VLFKFETTSESTYVVDIKNRCLKRVSGIDEPTQNLGHDNTWRQFLSVIVAQGMPAYIFWAPTLSNINAPAGTIAMTKTSIVKTVVPTI